MTKINKKIIKFKNKLWKQKRFKLNKVQKHKINPIKKFLIAFSQIIFLTGCLEVNKIIKISMAK